MRIENHTDEKGITYPGLKGYTPQLREIEAEQIEMMKGWSFAQKQAWYGSYRFASDERIHKLGFNKMFQSLNTPYNAFRLDTIDTIGSVVAFRWLHEDVPLLDYREMFFDELLPYPTFVQLGITARRTLRDRAPELEAKAKARAEKENKEHTPWTKEQLFRTIPLRFLFISNYKRYFVQTENGFRGEKNSKTLLNDSGEETRSATVEEDQNFSCDLIGTHAYQVKPPSFFTVASSANSKFRESQIRNMRGLLLWQKVNGREAFFLNTDFSNAGELKRIKISEMAFMCGLTAEYQAMKKQYALAA